MKPHCLMWEGFRRKGGPTRCPHWCLADRWRKARTEPEEGRKAPPFPWQRPLLFLSMSPESGRAQEHCLGGLGTRARARARQPSSEVSGRTPTVPGGGFQAARLLPCSQSLKSQLEFGEHWKNDFWLCVPTSIYDMNVVREPVL